MSKNLNLENFMKKVEDSLESYSLTDLKNVIKELALETTPLKRQCFLSKLNTTKNAEENLLEEIAVFKQKVAEKYYYEGWGWDSEHNKKRAFGDETWTVEIDILFKKTINEVSNGSFELAEKAFTLLFELLEENENPRYLPGPYSLENMIETDMSKVKNLYLCCIYHNTNDKERLKRIWKTLNKKYLSDIQHVNLSSMVALSKKPFPDFDNFLSNWIKILRKAPKKTSISSFLLREALKLKGGTKAIAKLALNEGIIYPEAYIDWIEALEEEKNYEQIVVASLNGLKNLDKNFIFRSKIALKLVKAGEKLNDLEIQLKAYREAFYSNPTLESFLSLFSLAKKQNREKEEIEIVLTRLFELLENKEQFSYNILDKFTRTKCTETLLCQVYLISGEFKKAFERFKDYRPLKWSSTDNPKGLIVSSLLYLLSPVYPKPEMVKFIWDLHGFPKLNENYQKIVDEAINNISFTPKEENEYLLWCIEEIGERVDKVLNTTYYSHHHKAAKILIAMAEVIATREELIKGFYLIRKFIRNYSRKKRFVKELREIMPNSKLFSCYRL